MRKDHSESQTEVNMEALIEFETRLTLTAPQPRPGFEQELAQRLQREFMERGQATRVLTSTRARRFGRVSTRSAAILVAILMVGIGVAIAMSGVLQQLLGYDAGLKAILDQGLGHEIGLSQTHDGFTVTLEWAYADGNRLTFAYMIEGHTGTQYTNLSSDVIVLTTRDTGAEIPFIQSMNALLDRNDAVANLDANIGVTIADRSLTIVTADMSAIDADDSPALDLHLETDAYGITLQRRTQMPMERFNDMKEGPDERFTFDFSIPLTGGQRVLDTAQTATDQDITVTLQRVTVSPSQTRVVVCFAPPDPARQWTAFPHLTTSAGEVPGGGGVRTFVENDLSCSDFIYLAGMYDYTGEWRLEISELIGFGSGGGNDQQRIAGAWTFEFAVPAAE